MTTDTTTDVEAAPAAAQHVSRRRDKSAAAWPAPLDLAEKVGDYTLREIRDLLRWLGNRSFRRFAVARRLKLSKRDAYAVITSLADRGFLAVNPHDPDLFEATIQGVRLRNTRMWKRIPRARADKIVAALVARAEEMNASSGDEWLYQVDRILAFGSYTSNSPTLGDIDIVLETSIRGGARLGANPMHAAKRDAEDHLRDVSRRYVRLAAMDDAGVLKAISEGSIWCVYKREGLRFGKSLVRA